MRSKARVHIGLQPYQINSFVWAETAAGIQLFTDNLTLAWMRGKESITGSGENWGDNDLDGLSARYDFKSERMKAGLFGLFQWQDTSEAAAFALASNSWEVKNFGNVEFDLFTFGTDGSFASPTTFGNFLSTGI